MNIEGLVLGLLDTTSAIEDPMQVDKYRGFTISWSRYGYHDSIIEGTSVDQILAEANQQGFRYCLMQPYGHIIQERWSPDGLDFFTALKTRIEENDFLVIGPITDDSGSWFGFQPGCLLVNLEKYRQLDAPSFGEPSELPVALPAAAPHREQGKIASLRPVAGTTVQVPELPGWSVISSSLAAGVPVMALGHELESRSLNLEVTCPSRSRAFASFLDQNITRFHDQKQQDDLSHDQSVFLNVVASQTANARKGVFLWNIESYDDIEQPRHDFLAPVSSLYSVAAGFKPNRILQTHGFDEASRVVYFDYSPNALEVKKCMVQQWDGEDFPHFVQYLFKTFPYPETFYQLWNDLTPEEVKESEIDDMWERELVRWGGARAFSEHWRAYRKLRHEYVSCDLLADSSALLEKITKQSSSIVWWSNAFFTMYGNWFFSWGDRKRIYDRWIEQIVHINSELYLFGSDYINSNVNFRQASQYWDEYRRSNATSLSPCKSYKTEIRM